MDPVVGRPEPVYPIQIAKSVNALPGRLVPGQLLEATVERALDSTVLLEINDRLLSARTEVPLEEQQSVWLQVVEAGTARIRLRVVENPQRQTSSPTTLTDASIPDPLQQTLMAWGFEPDDLNLMIARALLRHARTLTLEDMRAVRTTWQAQFSSTSFETTTADIATQYEESNVTVGENEVSNLVITLEATTATIQAENVEALAYLHTRHLPVGKESLALARHCLMGAPHLAARLLDLQETMQRVIRQLNPAGSDNPVPDVEKLVQLLQTAADQIANWRITPDTPTGEVEQRLAALITGLGTPLEAVLANQLSTEDQTSLLALVEGEEGEAQVATSDFVSQHETSRALAQIKSLINDLSTREDIDLMTYQMLYMLDQRIDEVFRDVGTLQLSNLGNAPDLTAGSYYLFPIPIETHDGVHTAFLKVFKQSRRRTLDGRQFRLALLLDLPGLGEIVVDFGILDRRINGQILSARESTHSLVEAELDHLRRGLGTCGFSVDSMTSALMPAVGERSLSDDFHAPGAIGCPAQIDVVV